MLNIKTQTKQIGIPFSVIENKTVKDVIDEVREDLGLGDDALLYRNGSQLRNKDTIEALKVLAGETLATFQETQVQVPPAGPGAGTLELGDESDKLKNLDGLKGTPWVVDRELCDKIIEAVDSSGRVLVRAPYSSGKTSLAQLLQKHLKNNYRAYIISLVDANGENWESYWEQRMHVNWKTIATSSERVYIIIDEVQISYCDACGAKNMWQLIKGIGNTNPKVRFICFGSYGTPAGLLPTPLDFQTTVAFTPQYGIPGMAYTEQEFLALCVAYAENGGFPIDDKSANYLFHMTNGYPGIIGWILLQAYHHFKNRKGEAAKHFYLYLHSSSLLNAMVHETCRAIPNFAGYESEIDLVCKHILSAPSFRAHKDTFIGFETQLAICLKVSIVIDDGGIITFAAPIIQNKALSHFFGSRIGTKPQSLREFVIMVVQRFSSQQLANSESRDTQSRLMEAQWQQEFYRAAASLLPRNVFISPEYGREQGVKGQVDFYIAEYKWMIEILRDGIDMLKHERRFEAGGQYETLLGEVDTWAVIDFRAKSKTVKRGSRDNTYHFSFANNFSTVGIRGPGGFQETVPLLGDQIDAVQSNSIPGGTPSKLSFTHPK